jgi:hypothetical protein
LNNTTSKVTNVSSTSSYRQRALNRQQPKVEEPKVEIAEVEEQKYNFAPEDATNLKNTLNSRLQRINDKSLADYAKTLTPEKIEELKSTSAILHPELLEKKSPDAKYYFGKFALGTNEAVENIADATVALGSNLSKAQNKVLEGITSVGGLLPNKVSEHFKNEAEELQRIKENAYANDFLPTKELGEILEYEYAPSKTETLAGDVLSGVGGMLPTIAANLLAPGAGYAVLGAQGVGGGTKQAYNKTGELGAVEEIYGALSGAAEILVEKLSGGIGGLGNGAVDDIAKKIIKNGLIRNATGEGIEEAITTFIDPYLQRITYDKGAEGAKASEVLRSALVGSLTSMLLQGGSAAINLPQNIQQSKQNRQELRNSLEGIEKMLPTYESQSESATSQENVARELPTMASQQAMLPTNRIEGQTVQTGNMEQIAKNIENNNILEYNNNRGGINEGNQLGGMLERVGESSRSDQKNQSTQTPKHTRAEYEQFEKSIRPISEERLSNKDRELVKTYKTKYNKDVVLFDGKENNGYAGGASLIDKNKIYVDINLAKQFGENMVASHEVMESDVLHNPELKEDLIKPVISKIINDPNFEEQKIEFWKGQEGEMPSDYLIAKDIICDRFAELDNNEALSYKNVLSQETNMTLDYGITNFRENINTQADTQSAFSMPKNYIDPSQDIQKATEFINKATVEDIDTLNKMVEEAEKYPDRLDLQFFAEKARARLEKISREQVENMVEEGIKQNKISYSDSIYRNLRRALGEKGYQYAKENILDKLDAAKLDNVNMKIEIANELKSYVVDELGIKKGSKESELVQKYGEKEITLDELKEATPNWENVVKADKWFRSKYDQLIDMINESRTEIYPYIEEKIEATELELEVVKQQIKDIEENGTPNYKKDAEIRTRIENIKKRIDAKDEKLESIKNKDTMAYKNNLRIKNEAVESLNDLNDLLDVRAENKLYKLKEKAEKLQKTLDSEELWRGKRIPKRKDYYRHFQEMTEGFEALGNILATPSEISSQLSGISENTKPNAKWLGLAQRRLTNKTKYDAVGGFLNYLDSASYAINIDPEIKRIRDFTEEIRKASGDNTTANRLIEYLTDYANDLAGKTNPMDRYLQKIIPGGRKTMKAISWLTNRIKSNAVLGNFNSAAAQILNLPQGLADIKNPKNIGIGFWETLTGKDSRYKDSQFITERFESDVYSQFDEKLIDQPKKMATWLLGALDEFGTKTIWNGEYSKAVDMGIKDPVRYADYRTRDLVAGRGIGELSLNQRSKTIGLLAPFTVEVSNYWGVVKDFISAKDFGGLILLQVFGHLFNEGLEELGISAGVFDLIDALIDAWNTEDGIDKKVGRVAGEYLSNTMFGQQLASLYPENGADLGVYKLPTRSELFGDADPTRMGTGSVLSKAITNPITSVVMPWGGTQLNKTAQGLSTFAKGGSYTKDAEGKDKLKYPVEQTPSNAIKSALFGKWATPGAKDYIDRGFKPLSANQTEAYEKAMKAGISSDDFFKAYDATRGIEGDKDKNGKTIENSKSKKLKEAIDKATTKLTSKQRKILYDAFNVSKTVQGGSGLPTQSELRANLPKVEIKIEK